MKKYILLFIFLISSIVLYSQEIIEYKGDTVIAISQENLKTINSIIVEYESNKEELNLYKKSSLMDSVLIQDLKNTIIEKDSLSEKKYNYYNNINKDLELIIEREKKKHRITKTLLGGAVIGLGVAILMR